MSLPPVSSSPVHPPPQDPNAALRKHVAEFEGLLLSQILEKLKDAYHMPGEEETNAAGESFQSLANSALGNSLAANGGLGLTNLLVQSLTKNSKAAAQVKSDPSVADIQGGIGRKH